MIKLYEIHILLSFTRKIKPEYEDIDDDGGNYWQHDCQPELYMGVHLDITITLNNPGFLSTISKLLNLKFGSDPK